MVHTDCVTAIKHRLTPNAGNQRGRTYVWLEATIKEDVLDVDHKRIGFEKLWFYATNNKKYKFRVNWWPAIQFGLL